MTAKRKLMGEQESGVGIFIATWKDFLLGKFTAVVFLSETDQTTQCHILKV